ncbi:NUDIX domain-containing protein [Arenicella sp. 4NH20-0111]|uniref:NUDIX hydrolase n=1 Tax=Arenicella sp. 4NH20-0111 TaxID=3127648 RepID=UPI0031049DC4
MHNNTVDNLIFGCEEDTLEIFLVKHGQGQSRGKWGLPGDWLLEGESLENAAARTLKERTGITDVYLEQLHTFSDVDRYPDERVITTAFFALIRPESYKTIVGETEMEVKWFPINKLPKLIFDHKEIVEKGLEKLKHKVRHEPIGFSLLPKKFTLLQLQNLYEAILETRVDKPNFRRKMKKMQLLVPLEEKQVGVAHRAANLYRFDEKVYRKLKTKGFVFEL